MDFVLSIAGWIHRSRYPRDTRRPNPWFRPVSSDSSGAVLDALDVLHPLRRLATASREGAYSHLVGMRTSGRLDWYFNLSSYITTGNTPL